MGYQGVSMFALLSPHVTQEQLKRWKNSVMGSPKPAIAILPGSFGWKWKNLYFILDGFVKKKKDFLCEIHFVNGASRRKAGRLHSGDLFPQDSVAQFNKRLETMSPATKQEILKRVHKITKAVAIYHNKGKILLSMGLEDNYTRAAALNLWDVLRTAWPVTDLVRCPVTGNPDITRPPAAWFEQHGYSLLWGYVDSQTILNPDGQDLDFMPPTVAFDYPGGTPASETQVRKWMELGQAKGATNLIWVAKHQGLHLPPTSTKNRRIRVDGADVGKIKKLYLK